MPWHPLSWKQALKGQAGQRKLGLNGFFWGWASKWILKLVVFQSPSPGINTFEPGCSLYTEVVGSVFVKGQSKRSVRKRLLLNNKQLCAKAKAGCLHDMNTYHLIFPQIYFDYYHRLWLKSVLRIRYLLKDWKMLIVILRQGNILLSFPPLNKPFRHSFVLFSYSFDVLCTLVYKSAWHFIL